MESVIVRLSAERAFLVEIEDTLLNIGTWPLIQSHPVPRFIAAPLASHRNFRNQIQGCNWNRLLAELKSRRHSDRSLRHLSPVEDPITTASMFRVRIVPFETDLGTAGTSEAGRLARATCNPIARTLESNSARNGAYSSPIPRCARASSEDEGRHET